MASEVQEGRPKGGSRPGAGRPRKADRVKTLSVCLRPALVEAVHQAAEAAGESVSVFVSKVLERAVRQRLRAVKGLTEGGKVNA